MIGANKKPTNPTPTSEPVTAKQKVAGTSYDLCKKVKQPDGSEKTQRIGSVFIRSSGTGGVAFLTDDDGTRYELPIFARSKRREGPKSEAAAQPEAAVAA